MPPTAEHLRLQESASRAKNWKRWGPYLAERQWGTVREDYSAGGDAWGSFPHDHARSRAYRWGEDGLLGICDRECRLCFSVALWNGRDPILKERLFGLTNPEGNHGEDAKEAWFYLDATPTHSWLRALYKYPQSEYPYRRLVEENARRGKGDREFEIHDTGVFDEQRYFDVFAEYAKAGPENILVRLTLENRAAEAATLHVLPTLWFRNTWAWGTVHGARQERPLLQKLNARTVHARHETLGDFLFECEQEAPLLFCENETNTERLYGSPIASNTAKDGFHDFVIHGRADAVSADRGTKVAPHYQLTIPAKGSATLRFRLRRIPEEKEPRMSTEETRMEHAATEAPLSAPADSAVPIRGSLPDPFADHDTLMAARRREADEFYATRINPALNPDQRRVIRQAYAGLLWSKQFYQYIVSDWLSGDPAQPPPPPGHAARNADWPHLYASDVLSMPDKWEYPWFAAWDLAFHTIPLSRVDPDFAKEQLELLLREWFMHPSGQMPAYEWNFGDVNPPVHAWACWRVYKIAAPPSSSAPSKSSC